MNPQWLPHRIQFYLYLQIRSNYVLVILRIQVPAFEATDGTCLTESNAIAYFVANNSLRASESPVHSAQVIQWMQFADSDILPSSCTWVFPTLGKL